MHQKLTNNTIYVSSFGLLAWEVVWTTFSAVVISLGVQFVGFRLSVGGHFPCQTLDERHTLIRLAAFDGKVMVVDEYFISALSDLNNLNRA